MGRKERKDPSRWANWTIQQHVDEAQRLAGQQPATAQNLMLAQVHATLAVQGTVEYSAQVGRAVTIM